MFNITLIVLWSFASTVLTAAIFRMLLQQEVILMTLIRKGHCLNKTRYMFITYLEALHPHHLKVFFLTSLSLTTFYSLSHFGLKAL